MDVIQPITLAKTLKITSDFPKGLSSDSESDTDTKVVEVAAVPRVHKYLQRFTITREKDALIVTLKDEISTLELSIKKLEKERRVLFRRLKSADHKNDITFPGPPHQLPDKQKRFNLSYGVMSSMGKYYPCIGDDNCALLLLDMWRDETIYDADGAGR